MYLPTEYCLLQCVPSRCPAFNCCHSTISAGVMFFRSSRRSFLSSGMLLVLFSVILILALHLLFFLFWKRRGTACGGGDGLYVQSPSPFGYSLFARGRVFAFAKRDSFVARVTLFRISSLPSSCPRRSRGSASRAVQPRP